MKSLPKKDHTHYLIEWKAVVMPHLFSFVMVKGFEVITLDPILLSL